jgi:hypothetical protein
MSLQVISVVVTAALALVGLAGKYVYDLRWLAEKMLLS